MTESSETSRRGLLERLGDGPVVCAEGYLFELERRGYLQAGAFVPEVILDHPEQVTALHRDFVHAGSDVVEALTYYAHREKLRAVGKDGMLEEMNRQALRLAREVADESGTLVAGNVCNTNLYDPDDAGSSYGRTRDMFEEQVGWAAEAGVDFVIGETFRYVGEALIALEVIRAIGLTSVITLAVGQEPATREGRPLPEACRRLADAGIAVTVLSLVMIFAARNEGFEPKGLDEMWLKPLDGAAVDSLLSSSVAMAPLKGSGKAIIDDKEYDQKQGDVTAIPVWAWHQYFNTGDEPLQILAISTRPALENLGLVLTHQGELADH
jgi:hypothetical protein